MSMNKRELYSKLKESLFIKKADINILKSMIIECKFPGDGDYIVNFANDIEDYVRENMSDKISDVNDYESILSWILFEATEDQIRNIHSRLDINYLFGWKTQDQELEYEKMSFLSYIDLDGLEDIDLSVHFLPRINQITDNLILLETPLDYGFQLFDYNGNYLNGKILNSIYNYGQISLSTSNNNNLEFRLGEDNLITVCGEWYHEWAEIDTYLLKYNDHNFETLEKVTIDFELENEKATNAANDITQMFYDDI